MIEELYTVDEAAAALKIHPQTVRALLRSGELRGIKRGRAWRIPESALTETSREDVERAEIENGEFENVSDSTRVPVEISPGLTVYPSIGGLKYLAQQEAEAQYDRAEAAVESCLNREIDPDETAEEADAHDEELRHAQAVLHSMEG